MSAFDLLETIGSARNGDVLVVCEPIVRGPADGDQLVLIPGTRVMVRASSGNLVFGLADMGDRLKNVLFTAEDYHCLKREP